MGGVPHWGANTCEAAPRLAGSNGSLSGRRQRRVVADPSPGLHAGAGSNQELRQDFIGGLGPDEGLRVTVVAGMLRPGRHFHM